MIQMQQLETATRVCRFSVKRMGRRIRQLRREGWSLTEIREILELPRGMTRAIYNATKKNAFCTTQLDYPTTPMLYLAVA